MTVCVALKVHDCIVFAADSATSLTGVDSQGNQHVVNIYDHANKVFNLHKRMPIAAMTAGIGNFGACSISTISKDLRALFMNGDAAYALSRDGYTMEEVAVKARRYLYEERFSKLHEKPLGTFQYWIGGYSAKQDVGEIWKIQIHDGDCPEPVCEASREVSSTISWGGRQKPSTDCCWGTDKGFQTHSLQSGCLLTNLTCA